MGAPSPDPPPPDTPPPDHLPPDPPKISLFFSSPATIFILSSSLGGPFVEFLVVFLKAGTLEMCTFGLSGCRVKPRRLWGSRGFTRQPENSKRAHFRAPSASNTTKIPRHDPQERKERKKIVAGKGKKSAKFWPPTFRGLHFFLVWLPQQGHPSGLKGSPAPSSVGAKDKNTNLGQSRPQILAKVGQIRMAKVGLAKVSISRRRDVSSQHILEALNVWLTDQCESHSVNRTSF